MIRFIICEDNIVFSKIISDEIDIIMFEKNIKYSKETFFQYDNNLENVINDTGLKIYLLDIVLPGIDGIEIAKKIREIDLKSQIIFLSAIETAMKKILCLELMVLTFISKRDYLSRFKIAVDKALFSLVKGEIVYIKSGRISYQIHLDEINYIYRDTFTRKSIIVTDNYCVKVNKPLCYFEKHYFLTFKKTHRACIVNKKNVTSVDFKEKTIVFKNGDKCFLISRSFKSDFHQ